MPGVEVEARDGDGMTPLMVAVELGKAEPVRMLVEVEEIDLDTKDNEGRSLEDVGRGQPEIEAILYYKSVHKLTEFPSPFY